MVNREGFWRMDTSASEKMESWPSLASLGSTTGSMGLQSPNLIYSHDVHTYLPFLEWKVGWKVGEVEK